jgi:hypothetical protein
MTGVGGAASRALQRWRRTLKRDARHLRDVEAAGESGETPYIAILEVALFLLPIVLLVLGLAFAAYYLG